MKTRLSIPVFGLAILLILLVLPGAVLAQPVLTNFSFTPTSINTASAPANVTVNFTATDSASNLYYFEMLFVDSTGAYQQRGFKSFTPASSVTDSVVVTFPAFSKGGTWKVAAVFLADQAGNTLYLDTAALAAHDPAFPTDLTVTSAVDTTLPNINTFSFTPASIDTAPAAQDVTVNFTVSDASGVASVYAGFVSPSGQITRGTRVNAGEPGFPTQLTINFPQLSEAGIWKVSFINVVDAAGNSLLLNTAAAAAPPYNFPTALTVSATPDTVAPSLTAFSFSPTTIGVNGGNVLVNFTATDDASGVETFQVVFRSPSGNTTLSGVVSFPPGPSVSSAAVVSFPGSSEPGTWTVSTVFLADVATNPRTCTSNTGTGCAAFPTGTAAELTVSAAPVDTTPPVITVSVSPAQYCDPCGDPMNPEVPIVLHSPNGLGWYNTDVTVTWTVTDPESTVTSPACAPATLTNNTSGTTLTCEATSSGGTSSLSVLIRIDKTAPTSSTPIATPNPVPATSPLTITATITDVGGSNVAAAQYNVDGGPFQGKLDGTFGGSTADVEVTLPVTDPVLIAGGVHTFCVRGIDGADNVGSSTAACVTVTITAHTPPPPEPFGVRIGVLSTPDQAVKYDIQVEVLKNGVLVTSGLTRCAEAGNRFPQGSKQVAVGLDALTGVNTGDVLSFRISSRIGTNPDDTKCEPAAQVSSAGLRLYYDSVSNPSLVTAVINGNPPSGDPVSYFLHTTGTSDFFDTTAPTGSTAKTKDSAAMNFAGGNPFKVIGTWSRTQP